MESARGVEEEGAQIRGEDVEEQNFLIRGKRSAAFGEVAAI